MTEQKYCPLQKEGVKCARWCAWYDEAEQQCAVISALDKAWRALSVVVEKVIDDLDSTCYTITPAGVEYLKGAGQDDNQR